MVYQYGVPYRGSKNRLAERIVAALPPAKHFYDLFAGGCAIAHAALLSGKWQCVHINDRDPRGPRLFLDAIAGRYQNETRFIPRAQFFAERDADAYIALVWSFSNNTKDYLYAREIEPFKAALHRAVLFADYEPLCQWQDARALIVGDTWQERLASLRRCASGWKLENLERLLRLQHLGGLLRLQHGDWQEVEIERDAVIYCDIPYRHTEAHYKAFDHERFYDWAERQRAPIFVSEYAMPSDRFGVFREWRFTATCAATAAVPVVERLFRPLTQYAPPPREVCAPLFA